MVKMPLLVDTAAFLAQALAMDGRPYLWGRKGPDAFDCSGLVTWALFKAGGPDWRYTHGSQSLRLALAPMQHLPANEPGLVFYGHMGIVNHVMVALPDGRAFGACGGDHTCTSLAAAAAKPDGGARVRFRSSFAYRRDLIGFCRLSYPDLTVVPKELPNA